MVSGQEADTDGVRRPERVRSESPRDEAFRLLVTRTRAGLWLLLAANAVFAVVDLVVQPGEHLATLQLIKLVQFGTIGASFLLLARATELRAVQWIAVAAVCALHLTPAASGIVRGDVGTTVVLLLALATGSAVLLPWGVRCQLVTCVVAGLGLAANAIVVAGDVRGALGYGTLGVAVALAGTLLIAREHERTRRDRARMAGLLAGHSRILEMVALGGELPAILEALTELVESRVPGLRCSVLILEGDRLRRGVAPSLPASYSEAVDGLVIGPGVACCGAAAYSRRPVVVHDTTTDPLWAELRELAATYDIRACWSSPILAGDGHCLGTFAMYYREPRSPGPEEWRLIDVATYLAGVAIERRRTEDALARSRTRLEEESRLLRALADVGQTLIRSLASPAMLDDLCRMTTDLVGCDCSDTALRDTEGGRFVAVGAHGYSPEEHEALRMTHLPESLLRGVLRTLARKGVMQVRTDDIPDPVAAGLLRRFGFARTMYAPLRRGETVVGILFMAKRGRADPFTALQERIAAGIAQLASLALENARLLEELTRANQVKSEFVSTMSHELRTPLSVILGYTDILQDGLESDGQRQTLDRIRRSGLELLEMIQSTLDLNRLEAGKDPAVIEELPLAELVEELAGEFAAVGGPSTTTLRWDVPADLAMSTDRRKLKIVLKNLVGNALKFTPGGEVVVRARRKDDAVVVAVRDTGIGIDPAQIQVIFDMFRQADGSDSRTHGGVGLGLYITRRLVTELGGEIRVESAPGAGSTFEVILPQSRRETAVPAPAV